MKKIVLLILILLVNTSCTYIPIAEDFKLSYTVSNQSPKIGDEIEVTATLENLSNSDFNFEGYNPIPHITIVNLDDPHPLDYYYGTISMIFKAHQKKSETKKLLIQRAGKYSISAESRFIIKNPDEIPASTFDLKMDPTIIEVFK